MSAALTVLLGTTAITQLTLLALAVLHFRSTKEARQELTKFAEEAMLASRSSDAAQLAKSTAYLEYQREALRQQAAVAKKEIADYQPAPKTPKVETPVFLRNNKGETFEVLGGNDAFLRHGADGKTGSR